MMEVFQTILMVIGVIALLWQVVKFAKWCLWVLGEWMTRGQVPDTQLYNRTERTMVRLSSISRKEMVLNRKKTKTIWKKTKDRYYFIRHQNMFEEGELNREVVVAKYATTTQHGAGWAYPYQENNSLTNTPTPAATLNNDNCDSTKLMSKPITDMKVTGGLASFNLTVPATSGITGSSTGAGQLLYRLGMVHT